MDKIVLESPLDMHLHLRDETMLEVVAPLSAKNFSGALIMPNLVPPISTKDEVKAYKQRILKASKDKNFNPYMTLFFKNTYTKTFLKSIKDDILAIKMYPDGVTTNSQGGVSSFDLKEIGQTLQAMSDLGIVLAIHGESNGFVMDREAEFIPLYEQIAQNFPNLKIIMEHITTKIAVDTMKKYNNLHATITLHHLLITLDDLAGGMLKPHLFCKPIAKRPEDKEALLALALSGHSRVMFGSDSAPHPQHKKESCGCAAGVFTAPIAIEVLVSLFDKHNSLKTLPLFLSQNAQNIYQIKPPKKILTLEKIDHIVPKSYTDIIPMYAGEILNYKITNIEV